MVYPRRIELGLQDTDMSRDLRMEMHLSMLSSIGNIEGPRDEFNGFAWFDRTSTLLPRNWLEHCLVQAFETLLASSICSSTSRVPSR